MLNRLKKDEKGAAIIEMAFALPVLITIMIGILQFALVLQASGAMRNGLGEGLRYAKVTASATETEVLTKVRAGLKGIDSNGIKSLSFTTGTSNGATFGRITMQYELKPVIPFAAIKPIVLNATRTVYLPS